MTPVTVLPAERASRLKQMRQAVAAPLGVWFAGRAIGLVVFALVAWARDRSMLAALTSWDGQYFLAIAERGYPATNLAAAEPDTSLAFLPGYPLSVRLTADVTDLPPVAAGLLVTALAGAALALGLVALAREIGLTRRVGLLWVAVAGASPLSVVFLMTYTEALFCALAVWGMVAVLRRQWPVAALFAIGCGLTRPTGVAVIVVVVAAALLDGWRSQGRRRVISWASAAAAPLGLAGYLLFVAYRTGSITGWFEIQQLGWHTHLDGGLAVARFVGSQLTGPQGLMEATTVVVILAVPVLVWAAIRVRLPWPLMVYSLVVVAMTLASDGVMNSKIRMLLPALPLLLPLATGLAKLRGSTQIATIVIATLAASWFGAYCLLIYPYAI